MKNAKKFAPYVLFPALALFTGWLSSLMTGDAMEDYVNLIQPPLAPPSEAFPIVWTILYVIMGISMAMIYNKSSGAPLRRSINFWGIQLLVNMFWSLFYFRLQWRLFAFYWLGLLIVLVIAMLINFKKTRPATALINLPYLAWLLFAAYLNFATWYLNG